jgi:polyketide cyclase/dehydrase/lipid transport protein
MTLQDSVEIVIDAAPESVYALVSDVTRMGEWSTECVKCTWLGSVRGPEAGARFRGTSRNGWHRWSTTSTVTVADPGRTFEFAVSYVGMRVATWRYDLAPDGVSGTTLRESVDDQRGPFLRTVSPFITGSRDRHHRNAATMRTTLERLKMAAEA